MNPPFDVALAGKLIPLYALVVIGFLLGRVAKVRSHEIGALALYVLSPAVVFKGFHGARLDGALAVLPFAVYGLACLVAWLSLPLAAGFWRDGRERIAAFAAATGNTGFFGIPACLVLLGPDSLPAAVMISFGFTAYENTVGYFTVARAEATVAGALMRVLRYPGLHACWLGVTLNLLDVRLPAFVPQTVDLLAGGFSAVGMMIVGLGLAQVARPRPDLGFLGFAFAWKFLFWPVAAVAFVWVDRTFLQSFPPIAHQVMLVQSLAPMAAVTVVHATLRDVHPDRAAVAVAASTLFALVWLPLVHALAA